MVHFCKGCVCLPQKAIRQASKGLEVYLKKGKQWLFTEWREEQQWGNLLDLNNCFDNFDYFTETGFNGILFLIENQASIANPLSQSTGVFSLTQLSL